MIFGTPDHPLGGTFVADPGRDVGFDHRVIAVRADPVEEAVRDVRRPCGPYAWRALHVERRRMLVIRAGLSAGGVAGAGVGGGTLLAGGCGGTRSEEQGVEAGSSATQLALWHLVVPPLRQPHPP